MEVVDAGEQVMSVVATRGRGLASGVEVEREHAGLWTVRAGTITRVEWFDSREEALQAAKDERPAGRAGRSREE